MRKILIEFITLLCLFSSFSFAQFGTNPSNKHISVHDNNTWNGTNDYENSEITVSTMITPSASGILLLLKRPNNQYIIYASSTVGKEYPGSGEPTSPIYLKDNISGGAMNEYDEALVTIDSNRSIGFYMKDGAFVNVDNNTTLGNTYWSTDDKRLYIGAGSNMILTWDSNGAADGIGNFSLYRSDANNTAALFFNTYAGAMPSGMTYFNDYVAPTLILTGATALDASDFTGLEIGARQQSDASITNYIDFLTLTGAVDNSIDASNVELEPIIRVGRRANPPVATPSISSAAFISGEDMQIGSSGSSKDLILYDVNSPTQAYKIEVINGVLTPAKID